MTGCGSTSITNIGQNIQVSLDPLTQQAKLEVEMTSGLQVSMAAGNYLIQGNWGDVYFVDATKTTNSKIGIALNIATIVGEQLNFSVINALPNAAPLPIALTGPLFQIPVTHTSSMDVSAVLSLTPELQLGAMVGISQFSSQYVIQGVAVCQNFRDSSNVAYAAICLYGPSGTKNGGIFIGGTLGNVIPANLIASSSATVPSSKAMTLQRSAVFTMPLSSMADLNLPATNTSSAKFTQNIYDPKNQVYTSAGLRSYNNVQKVLKVR